MKIRALVIPRIQYKQAYIHVGKMYEGRKVSVIRHEPFDVHSVYTVYDEDGLICQIENCPVIVYYEKGAIKHEN